MGIVGHFENFAHEASAAGCPMLAALLSTMADAFDLDFDDGMSGVERYEDKYTERLTSLLPTCSDTERSIIARAIELLDGP